MRKPGSTLRRCIEAECRRWFVLLAGTRHKRCPKCRKAMREAAAEIRRAQRAEILAEQMKSRRAAMNLAHAPIATSMRDRKAIILGWMREP